MKLEKIDSDTLLFRNHHFQWMALLGCLEHVSFYKEVVLRFHDDSRESRSTHDVNPPSSPAGWTADTEALERRSNFDQKEGYSRTTSMSKVYL